MTDKEFRKLKRGDLIAIIYEYQKKQDELTAEVEELKQQLASREVKLSKAGSIAEAVVGMNELFETAQRTADEYIEKIKQSAEEAEKKAAEIISEAEKKAKSITEEAEKKAKEEKSNVS